MSVMNVLLTGGSGFIGGKLITQLQARGMTVHILGRRPPAKSGVRFSQWDALRGEIAPNELGKPDAVIHLAGEPVAQRWNADVKRRIRDSRGPGTRGLVQSLLKAKAYPRVLVSASATGYYGDRGDEILTESSPPGTGFLPDVCCEWEEAAMEIEAAGSRVALIRIGIVLGRGGALKQMLPPFRLGLGGKLGPGQQWMSWIHVDDLVEMILFALTNAVEGPINGVAPEPVRNVDFTRALAETVHRPAVLRVPKIGLELLFGEMADVMLTSQRVLPNVATSTGFQYRFADLRKALDQVIHDQSS